MKNRREKADNILIEVQDYLKDAGWTLCYQTFFHVDPVTTSKYSTDTAFCIQLGRDMTK